MSDARKPPEAKQPLTTKEKHGEAVKEFFETEKTYISNLTKFVQTMDGLLLSNEFAKQHAAEIKLFLEPYRTSITLHEKALQGKPETWAGMKGFYEQLEMEGLNKTSGQYLDAQNFFTALSAESKQLGIPNFTDTIFQALNDGAASGLGLGEYLILPIQRGPRYKILMDPIEKYSSEKDKKEVEKVMEDIKVKMAGLNMTAGNYSDMMGRIKQEKMGVSDVIKSLDKFKSMLPPAEVAVVDKLAKALATKTLAPEQMEKELRNVIKQLKDQPIGKEAQEAKSTVIKEVTRKADELKRQIKQDKKSKHVSVYSALATRGAIAQKIAVDTSKKDLLAVLLTPAIQELEQSKDKKLNSIVSEMKTLLTKERVDLASARTLLEAASKRAKQGPEHDVIQKQLNTVVAMRAITESQAYRNFMAPLMRNEGSRNMRSAVHAPAPESATVNNNTRITKAATLTPEQRARLAEARKLFSEQASKATVTSAGKAPQQNVEAAIAPARPVAPAARVKPVQKTEQVKVKPTAPPQDRKPVLRAKSQVQQPAPPIMGAKMSNRMKFFDKQHEQGVTQPKRILKKEPPTWPTPKKGPGRA